MEGKYTAGKAQKSVMLSSALLHMVFISLTNALFYFFPTTVFCLRLNILVYRFLLHAVDFFIDECVDIYESIIYYPLAPAQSQPLM